LNFLPTESTFSAVCHSIITSFRLFVKSFFAFVDKNLHNAVNRRHLVKKYTIFPNIHCKYRRFISIKCKIY
jgi:hypothetical protein